MRGPTPSLKPDHNAARRKLIKQALLGALSLWCGYEAVTSQRIDTNAFEVILPHLPASLDGLRIVQLSDLHRRNTASDKIITQSMQMAEALQPDVLVLTGDFVSSRMKNILPAQKLVSTARAKYGVYAVLGNHDNWVSGPKVAGALRADGIKVLVNKGHRPVPGLYIAGSDDWWTGHPDVDKAFQGQRPDEAGILLAHHPKSAETIPTKPVLVLSGHTHGGQICVPFVPRNWLPGLLGSHYIDGWYRNGRNLMYVNRGIGTTGPPVRFYCRPEITVYTLRHHAGATEVSYRLA